MPAPGTFPDWDTNGTHTTPIVSGHATDGFVNNEIPTSAELNQVLMLLGQWVRYLAKRESKVLPISAADGQVSCTVVNPAWFNIDGVFYPQHINDALVIPIHLAPGAHITQVTATMSHGLSGVITFDFRLFKRNVTTNAAGTQIGSTQTTDGSGGITAQTLTIGSLNETIASDTVYYAVLSPHSGSSGFGTMWMGGIEVTYDIPAI